MAAGTPAETPEYITHVYTGKPHMIGTVITHSDSPLLGVALQWWGRYANIEDGGVSEAPLIRLVVQPHLDDSNGDVVALAYPQVSNDRKWIIGCLIAVDPSFVGSLEVITHEVGHCLGLRHFDNGGNSLMSVPVGGWFSTLDIAAVRALYGTRTLQPQSVLPQISSD
jgi:hypothetical protein